MTPSGFLGEYTSNAVSPGRPALPTSRPLLPAWRITSPFHAPYAAPSPNPRRGEELQSELLFFGKIADL